MNEKIRFYYVAITKPFIIKILHHLYCKHSLPRRVLKSTASQHILKCRSSEKTKLMCYGSSSCIMLNKDLQLKEMTITII